MSRLATSIALLVCVDALAEPVKCPLILEEGAIKIVRPPDGWLGTSNSLARLTSGGLMRGQLNDMGYLRPEKTNRFKGGGWASNEFTAGEEKWLWCGYGGASALHLSKRLPDAATVCTVTYTATKLDGITAMSAECTTPSAPKDPARATGRP